MIGSRFRLVSISLSKRSYLKSARSSPRFSGSSNPTICQPNWLLAVASKATDFVTIRPERLATNPSGMGAVSVTGVLNVGYQCRCNHADNDCMLKVLDQAYLIYSDHRQFTCVR